MNGNGSSQISSSEEMNMLLTNVMQYGPRIIQNRPLIKMATSQTEKWIIKNGAKRHKNEEKPGGVINDETAMSLAILNSAKRALLDHNPSEATLHEAVEILGRDLFIKKDLRKQKSEEFSRLYGFNTPSFLVISPSKACNLRCTGCYADSDAKTKTLEWDLVNQIINDARELWGTQFIVVSGGEPMAYRSLGKTVLDLAENNKDSYFMMYTNGTLIDSEVASRMADLGNIVPTISLEGWRERTDARRGEGVFDSVMEAMDHLKEAGVLYGNSLTATRQNAEEILSDEFIDFLFTEKGSLICWIFQYMPIGRKFTLDLMPTPQQRLWMWKQSWKFVREKRFFLVDFWNHGTVVDGCLSAGGHNNGGYFYIEWNGNVTPCVFVPYSPVNVKDIYDRGGNLNDIYSEPFFSDIREWQCSCNRQHLLNPCLIRDHNPVLRQLIRTHEANPIDQNACAAIHDRQYAQGLDQYSEEYSQIADLIWEKVYLKNSHLTDDELTTMTTQQKLNV